MVGPNVSIIQRFRCDIYRSRHMCVCDAGCVLVCVCVSYGSASCKATKADWLVACAESKLGLSFISSVWT